MRFKAEIARLEADRSKVIFPAVNIPFSDWQNRLRKIVRDNFGSTAAKDMEWDEYEQAFCWSHSDCVEGGFVDGLHVNVKRYFKLRAGVPLAAELERVTAELQAFYEQRNKLAEILFKANHENKFPGDE